MRKIVGNPTYKVTPIGPIRMYHQLSLMSKYLIYPLYMTFLSQTSGTHTIPLVYEREVIYSGSIKSFSLLDILNYETVFDKTYPEGDKFQSSNCQFGH